MTVPDNPKIYHITHIGNLPRIIAAGQIYSDARRIEIAQECDLVGMTTIKERRLHKIEVSCHRGTMVGDYVPFYFCPRSVMLYLLYMGNHPDLQYRGGQGPLIHLQADLRRSVAWADEHGIRWSFSDGNAGSFYAQFYNQLQDLDRLNWAAIGSRDFRDPVIKEGKQAEFLFYGAFPWALVEKIGVSNNNTLAAMRNIVENIETRIEPGWYY